MYIYIHVVRTVLQRHAFEGQHGALSSVIHNRKTDYEIHFIYIEPDSFIYPNIVVDMMPTYLSDKQSSGSTM